MAASCYETLEGEHDINLATPVQAARDVCSFEGCVLCCSISHYIAVHCMKFIWLGVSAPNQVATSRVHLAAFSGN